MPEVWSADGFTICDSGLKLLTLWRGTISKWSYFQKSLRLFTIVMHVNILTEPFAKIGWGRESWVISQAWFSPCCQGQQTTGCLPHVPRRWQSGHGYSGLVTRCLPTPRSQRLKKTSSRRNVTWKSPWCWFLSPTSANHLVKLNRGTGWHWLSGTDFQGLKVWHPEYQLQTWVIRMLNALAVKRLESMW